MRTMITSRALAPLIFICSVIFSPMILSVTSAIDSPIDNATLSRTVMFRKMTSVQAKPGRKNTSINPMIALRAGTLSMNGMKELNKWLKSTT